MATGVSGGVGAGGDDGEGWEKRRKANIEDNKRALREIVEEAKKGLKLSGKKGGKVKGKKKMAADPAFQCKAKPSQP